MQVSDEAILEAMEPFAAIRGRGTLPNLLAFARVLKMAGLKVSLSQLMDASRSLEFVDIGRREDFQAVLRSNLVSEKEEIATFDRVFDRFWRSAGLVLRIAKHRYQRQNNNSRAANYF